MRQLIIILTAGLVFWKCEKQREQIEKFVFDNKQIASRTIHNYEFYTDGKIKTDHTVTYYLVRGVSFDSIDSKKQFKYNSKGKIESIFNPTDSTKEFRLYSDIDSLIAEMTLNKSGDTTYLTKTNFRNGYEIKRTNRILSPRFPDNPEDIKTMSLRNYDTLHFGAELVYDGNQLIKTISKDKDGNVTEETEFIYNGDKKSKALKYSFMADNKYLSETTHYSNDNLKSSDYVTVGIRNDTLSYQKTVLQDGMRIKINYFKQFNSQNIWYYDKKNQLVGFIDLNYNDKEKRIYSYKYDDKGNVLEELNYKERISNAR